MPQGYEISEHRRKPRSKLALCRYFNTLDADQKRVRKGLLKAKHCAFPKVKASVVIVDILRCRWVNLQYRFLGIERCSPLAAGKG